MQDAGSADLHAPTLSHNALCWFCSTAVLAVSTMYLTCRARRLRDPNGKLANSDLVAVKHIKTTPDGNEIAMIKHEEADLKALVGKRFVTPLYSVSLPSPDVPTSNDAYLVMG